LRLLCGTQTTARCLQSAAPPACTVSGCIVHNHACILHCHATWPCAETEHSAIQTFIHSFMADRPPSDGIAFICHSAAGTECSSWVYDSDIQSGPGVGSSMGQREDMQARVKQGGAVPDTSLTGPPPFVYRPPGEQWQCCRIELAEAGLGWASTLAQAMVQ